MNCHGRLWLAVGIGAAVIIGGVVFFPKAVAGAAGGAAIGAGAVGMKYALAFLP